MSGVTAVTASVHSYNVCHADVTPQYWPRTRRKSGSGTLKSTVGLRRKVPARAGIHPLHSNCLTGLPAL